MNKIPIAKALELLDLEEDAHWTSGGLPLVDAVSAIMDKPVTRQEITDAAPEFTREMAIANAEAEAAQDAEEVPAADDADASATSDADTVDEPEAAAEGREQESPERELETKPQGELGDDDVLKMPMHVVLASRELTERAFAVINAGLAEATAVKNEAVDRIRVLSLKCDMLSRHMERMEKRDPNHAMAPIQQYLRRSATAREERAARARKFVEAGTSAKDVADLIRGGSKLDKAMERKTARGAQRPSREPAATQGG